MLTSCFKPQPRNRAHTEPKCEMSVKSDRRNKQTVGAGAPGPRDLTSPDMQSSDKTENVLLQSALRYRVFVRG